MRARSPRESKLLFYRLRSEDGASVEFCYEVYRDIALANDVYYASVLEGLWQRVLSVWAKLRLFRFRGKGRPFRTWRRFDRDILNGLEVQDQDGTIIALDRGIKADQWGTVGRIYGASCGWISFDAGNSSGSLFGSNNSGDIHPSFADALRSICRLEKDNFLAFTGIQITHAIATAIAAAIVIPLAFLAALASPILFAVLYERLPRPVNFWIAAVVVGTTVAGYRYTGVSSTVCYPILSGSSSTRFACARMRPKSLIADTIVIV
jgi:hypothetical protein